MHHIRVWLRLAKINFSKIYTTSRVESFLLVFGKLFRFGFFLIFIVSLLGGVKTLAGFSMYQIILFFLTYNFIDLTVQFFLRGIYNVRGYIRAGSIDLILTQPINVFFRVASDWIDFLDLLTLIPVMVILGFVMVNVPNLSLLSLVAYIALIFNALLIAFSIHLVVFGISLISEETSGEIWIYRDFMSIGRFPVDIFSPAFSFVLTYILPIGIMITFPTKILTGALSAQAVFIAFAIGGIFYFSSLTFFKYALRKYSSISS